MTETIAVAFRLNGADTAMQVPPDMRLIDMLRERLGLTAAKKACGIGRCGACAVLMDGRPVNACLLMAWQIDGADILTPEGLDALPEAAIVRGALAEENAFQCGYCAPGSTIALTALLREHLDADEPAIRAALEGNICRCTGYHSIIRGALAAVRAMADRSAPPSTQG
ncbi:(2Fe-2S)-binding protein [Mesorhizobium sp. M2A.F.Ca.ET.043.05.1.1]|uniref:(2Fe-2S)-binding protein n=1 Tax=Mesorhizobium sp. M2A.F.Ca.ET.043.05.1.1 TaxID=2493671 RepID=UPI000F75431E|nr:(2Fe-2S)-binding protein [Mesorhizobium sp. M2A.F.Ca.ET.043.05.1.1]AZO16437.1 (2Fe-2S)-binding protein [Mesorhizobium sp. M2A.F.Ca.ET.043.05.1.1]